MEKRPKVLIVGAGFAGLGAAHRLCRERGSKFDVKILEAASKVGGRISTLPVFGGCFELGCTFLYYNWKIKSPLPEYAIKKGLTNGKYKVKSPEMESEVSTGSTVYLLSNGDKLPTDAVQRYQSVYFKIRSELDYRSETGDWSYTIDRGRNWAECNPRRPDGIGYNEYITNRFSSVTKFDPEHINAASVCKPVHILNHMLTYEGFLNGAKMVENVDVVSFADYDDEPLAYLKSSKGYQSIADTIASEIPLECFHFSKQVQSVHWSLPNADSSAVTLLCTDGTTYQADHVILTVSLGVLQQKCSPLSCKPLFDPPLPEDKQLVIQKLGMGQVNKVALEFSKPLHSHSTGTFRLIWLESEYGFPEQYPWATKLYTVSRIRDSNMYMAWFCGEDAQAIEALEDSEVAEGICLVLEKFLQTPVERPIRVERSRWCKDQLFLGSYSYNTVGSSKVDREILAKPVSGSTPLQLLFAGEATHSSLFGTTNGAFETGIRAANEVLDLYK